MAEYQPKFCIQDKIISILFFAFFGVMGYGTIKHFYKEIVVINCQPIPQQVICKISNESEALEIPKAQLSRVDTIETRDRKGRKTERDILIIADGREIPLRPDYNTNRKERVTAFINDPLATNLAIDPRQNFVIFSVACGGLTTFILCGGFKDAWIDPRRRRRSS